MNLSVKEF